MKRRAIYLDANNDIYTTLGKLERLDADEIILVIPKSSVLFHSLINLKILNTEAHRQHKALSIVTVDNKGHQLAERVGIPAYKDLDLTNDKDIKQDDLIPTASLRSPAPVFSSAKGQPIKIKYKRKLPASLKPQQQYPVSVEEPSMSSRSSWRAGIQSFTAKSVAITINQNFRKNFLLLTWALGALVVLGIVIGLVIPKATVNLEIRSAPFVHSFKLVLADETDKEAVGQNVFKGRFVEVEKKLTQTFPATGSINNGNKASGSLTVYNHIRSTKPFGLRAQTRFLSPDGQIFKSQSELLISSATVGSNGKLMPGRASVTVEAESGGTKGNLPIDTKFTIPGLGANGIDLVYGQNEVPFVGGTDEETKMVTEEDISKAKESISRNVFIDAEAELQTKANKKEELIPVLVQNDVINVTPSVQFGTARDNFDLDIQVRSWTLLPPKGKLDNIMQTTVNTIVPENQALTSTTLRSLKLVLDNANHDKHFMDFSVMIDGAIAPKMSDRDIAESLANRSLKSVSLLFDSIPDVISHRVSLWPFWVKKMPLLEGNIKIIFSYINQ